MTWLTRFACLSTLAMATACNGSDIDSDVDTDTTVQGESAFLSSIFPADGASDVPVNTAIEIEFTAAVTAGERAVSLYRVGNSARESVQTEWLNDGTLLVVTPDSSLRYDAEYTVEIDDSVQSDFPEGDDFGQPWSFFTEPSPAPALLSSRPSDNSVGISAFGVFSATFDSVIDPSSLTFDSAYVEVGNAEELAYGEFSVSGTTVTWVPNSTLRANAEHTVVFTTDVTDTDGEALSETVEISFTTIEALQISSANPSNNQENVSVHDPVTLTFTQDIDPAFVTSDSLRVQVNGQFQNTWYPVVNGGISVSGDTLTFTPAGGTWQEFATSYTVYVDAQTVRGVDGQPFEGQATDFVTEMVSPLFTYHLMTTGTGRNLKLQTWSNSPTTHMGAADSGSSRWSFTRNANGSFGMRNDYSGQTNWLEGGDGNDLSLMTTGGQFTGQQWRFATFGGQPSAWQQQGFESPTLYYMETVFQGDDRALTMNLAPGSNIRVGEMANQTGLIYSLFWLKRIGSVNFQ